MTNDIDFEMFELAEPTDDSMNIGVRIGSVTARIDRMDFDEVDESVIQMEYKLHEGIPEDIEQFEQDLSRVIIGVLEDHLKKEMS